MNYPTDFRGAVFFAVSLLSFGANPSTAFSHGFAGDRFFPATITTDDPFAASEMSLPTFSEIRQPGQPPFKDFDTGADISVLTFGSTTKSQHIRLDRFQPLSSDVRQQIEVL